MGIAYGQVWGRKHNNVQPVYCEGEQSQKQQKAEQRPQEEKPKKSAERWTDAEIALCYDENLSIERISEMTGRTYQGVLQKCHKLHISVRGRARKAYKNGN